MSQSTRILVVDDEVPLRQLIIRKLGRQGYLAEGAGSGEEALTLLEAGVYHLAILDITMPGMNGIELLSAIKSTLPEVQVVMMTGHATIETAIEAMKIGAYDYLEKPVNMKELFVIIEKAIEKGRLATENRRLKAELARTVGQHDIVGESAAIRGVVKLIEKMGPTESPVLIEGESGTGKELVARALHSHSPRGKGPFVAINCGALQESLLENELFGHAKGSYTGATDEQEGLFETAHGGTLFIDEVCEMGLGVQKKFLRVLENGEFRRVGETRVRTSNARIVAATNRDVEGQVAAGEFREDLFYRLNVLRVQVPPLRERSLDIPVLARAFLEEFKRSRGLPRELTFSPGAIEALQRYHWPGNVRELRNIVERAVILSEGEEILAADLSLGRTTPAPTSGTSPQAVAAPGAMGSGASLDDLERQHIIHTLDACDGNKTQAAKALGVSIRTLYRKLEKHDISYRTGGP